MDSVRVGMILIAANGKGMSTFEMVMSRKRYHDLCRAVQSPGQEPPKDPVRSAAGIIGALQAERPMADGKRSAELAVELTEARRLLESLTTFQMRLAAVWNCDDRPPATSMTVAEALAEEGLE